MTPTRATARPRVAVLKPDYGSPGGFERHLDGLLRALGERGWHLELVPIPTDRTDRPFGISLDDPIRHRHDEFFLWAALAERVQALDLEAFDAVLTTQPPTYLADHPRKVALFYHHARQFYDQAELFVESGFVDPDIHTAAVKAVRSVEAPTPTTVGHWLAGSDEIAGRLRTFWNVPDAAITLHQAPPTTRPTRAAAYDPTGPVLVVGRLEWPKRQELAIAATWLAAQSEARWALEILGDGSRRPFMERLDAALAADPALAMTLNDSELWKNAAPRDAFATRTRPDDSPATFLGSLDDAGRDEAYARCSVVLTPTSNEDYGLTVLEAMANSRPVIVCADGGGLTEFVEHGVNGLIVEPTPRAIADAVGTLRSDPALATEMGSRGQAIAAEVTWERAVDTVEAALRRVLER